VTWALDLASRTWIIFTPALSNFCASISAHSVVAIMPIVGPPAQNATTTLTSVCAESVSVMRDVNATFVAPTEHEWWHPTIFVTSTTAYISLGVPDLTTVYDYSSECRDRWMIWHTCGNGDATVFSMDPSKDIVSDPLYRSCQRYSTPVYSPGVCPAGFTISEVTALVSGQASANSTFWQASCCRRFDYPHQSSLIYVTKTLIQWHDYRTRISKRLYQFHRNTH
jgi:hypothetical protein